MQNPTSANKGPESHNEPPSPLASWQGAGRWTRLECSAQKALSGPGPTVGPEAAPYPLWASCFPLLHLRPWNKSCGLWRGRGGRDGAEDRKERGMCGAEEGFGHGWSAQPSPGPCPYLLSHPEQGRCHVRQRAQAHTWSTPEPQQGQGCRTIRQRDLGVRRGGACAPPPTPALLASHLVSK